MSREGFENMLPHRSIRALYPLALAEEEGVGTAYEYYAKRRMLERWLASLGRPRRMLIAGLPEKYGCSLDFVQIAQDVSINELLVIDDRAQALEKAQSSLAKAQADGALNGIRPKFLRVNDLSKIHELGDNFDLCLGSEVLQRMDHESRARYVQGLCRCARAVGLFVPNGDNRNHTT